MKYNFSTGEAIAYSREERDKALQVSLTSLAASLGYTPIRSGSHYSLKEMDSLIIYNDRTWNRWSGKGSHTGGTQIDFMLEFGGMKSVPEAIRHLLHFSGEIIIDESVRESFQKSDNHVQRKELVLPPKNENYRRLYAYLIQTRGLSQEVVSDFVHRKLIYEDAVHHNVVYCGYDPAGNIRYAGLRGTADAYGKVFKMDVPGNDKNYGVNIVNKESSQLKVFESVIDCMSYIDLTGDKESNKLILGMVEDNPLAQFIKDYDHIKKITFCLDNDMAAYKALYGMDRESKEFLDFIDEKLSINKNIFPQATMEKYYLLKEKQNQKPGLLEKYKTFGYMVDFEIPPYGKDFNDSLKYSKTSSNLVKAKSNEEYVEDFYDQMMKIAGFDRDKISTDEMCTVKYDSQHGSYRSDGYGDICEWLESQLYVSEDQKREIRKLDGSIREICLEKNSKNEVSFYVAGNEKQKYPLITVNGPLYSDTEEYKLFYDFDGKLTAREIAQLSEINKKALEDYSPKAMNENVTQGSFRRRGR